MNTVTGGYFRDWVPHDLERTIQEEAARFAALPAAAVDGEVADLIATHERFMDRQCICLYAGTNMMNPKALRWLSSTVGGRPSLGYPGDKYETGMQHAERLEILAMALLRKLFGCTYAEIRVGSGSLANLYAFMACTRPGDRIMALSDAAAGHVTHHKAGAAGYYGLEVHEVPFDGAAMSVDLGELERKAAELRPTLVIVGASLCLFPYPVREVRAIADGIGARVLYDGAHVSGIIAGGRFQQPLAEGAHLMTTSTYKSFGGPPSGLILTNEADLAERLDAIAFPGLTANFDLGKTAALIVAVQDLLEFGGAYADACIANARALAEALDARGCPVHGAQGRGFTDSQHVALPAHGYGGGTKASRILEKANILTSGIGLPLPAIEGDFNGIRMGTQEITRWGMTPADMPAVADLISRVLVDGEEPEAVKADTLALRAGFQELHFVR